MSRSISLTIAGAVLALLVLWLGRGADAPPAHSDTDRPSVALRESLTESPRETPAVQQAPASSATPPQSAIVRTEPNIFTVMDGRPFPEVEPSTWSQGMESVILSYVSQHSSLALTDLRVQCEDTGCVIFMGGPSIYVEQLKFGVFAEEHGFAFVAIRDRDGTDGKIVILRR